MSDTAIDDVFQHRKSINAKNEHLPELNKIAVLSDGFPFLIWKNSRVIDYGCNGRLKNLCENIQ